MLAKNYDNASSNNEVIATTSSEQKISEPKMAAVRHR